MAHGFDSDPELQRLAAKARADLEHGSELHDRFISSRESTLEELAPYVFSRMLQNRQAAENALTDPDRRIRIAALLLFAYYWEPNGRIADLCKRIALDDPHSLVRGIALRTLLRCAVVTHDPRLAIILRAVYGGSQVVSAIPYEKTLQWIEDCRKADDQEAARARDSQRRRIEGLVGPVAQQLYESRDVAMQTLKHHEADARLAALTVVTYHWGPTTEFVVECERMATEDADANVRASALVSLGSCFAKTNDCRIGKLVAEIVIDELQHVKSRKAAYFSLFDIRGLPIEVWPICMLAAQGRSPDDFRFPEDVDYSFVNSFLGRFRTGGG